MTEVFKGGSMGHGTTVPGKFDIDLVLYSRSKNYNYLSQGVVYYVLPIILKVLVPKMLLKRTAMRSTWTALVNT